MFIRLKSVTLILMCFSDADELKQRILSIMSGKTVTSTNENLGDLLVPKPKEPLGSLGNESVRYLEFIVE